ncbi:GNAT family N-acetyltransferase [Acinetobacter sp. LoGeW2-3]|uniref:GNAT family N-acetyltransferase n=1 Tax=Acinetobacter sp. LoGeW2-3 TaxID=1808001 RepID=UPI000C05BF1B|nr:GNAT family N-acetyltransferase [Acinetobacter sp. LoGeW2-3]ATO20394.1 GNAT family N-acetyltransferase [Acinetobacter sp. LoGeW2-3]
MKNNNIRLATLQEIEALVALINNAYRSNLGWTHEHSIVSGDRINEAQLSELLIQPDYELYVLEKHGQVIGLTELVDAIEIGSFAIDPERQNSGYGRVLLDFAEAYTKQKPPFKTLRMSVLNVRTELIAYYERRGYSKTGEIKDYPLDANVGWPLLDLNLVVLEKCLD